MTFTYNPKEIWVSCSSISSCTCSADSNWCPFEPIFSYSNREKSAGEIDIRAAVWLWYHSYFFLLLQKTSGRTVMYTQQQCWGKETRRVSAEVPTSYSQLLLTQATKQAECWFRFTSKDKCIMCQISRVRDSNDHDLHIQPALSYFFWILRTHSLTPTGTRTTSFQHCNHRKQQQDPDSLLMHIQSSTDHRHQGNVPKM
jgi:hypothetical protein